MRMEDFSKINLARCNTWHDINDWDMNQWAVAMVGEAGEICNKIKKLNRLEDNIQQNAVSLNRDQLLAEIGEEIADTFIYLDLLAQRLGLRLNQIVIDKFNKTSDREKLPHKISPSGVPYIGSL